MALAPRWLRVRAGVRVASALSAAAVVAVALVVSGAALILLVGHSLSRSVQDDAIQQAQALATRMHGNYGRQTGDLFTPKENAVEAIDTLVGKGDPAVAQILVDFSDKQNGGAWAFQAGSDDDAAPAPTSFPTPAIGQTIVEPSTAVPLSGGAARHSVLVAVGGITTTDEPQHFVVLYFAPLAAVDAAQSTVEYYLLLGVPFLIVVAGMTTYVFAGRALRPVEAMRAQVASMSEKDLARRVPVPEARDEVGRLAETMNAMIARLEDAQGVQRRFVADASHELRSPLATISAGLELLAGRRADRDTVAALRGETERLGRLVDDLLLLARADERGLRPRRDEVDLDEMAEGERGRPSDRGVRIRVQAEHVRVIGDRGQLVRVLRNLVDNARRHAESQVLVTLAREDGHALLDVADDGPGVPIADRNRMFERFVRLDDARARGDGGSGLGLAIVAEVVAAHGGTVRVEDAPGGGALFRVRLPAVALPDTAQSGSAEPDAAQSGSAEPGTTQTGTTQTGTVPELGRPVVRTSGRAAAHRADGPTRPGAARRAAAFEREQPIEPDDPFAGWVPPQHPVFTPFAAVGPELPGPGDEPAVRQPG